MKKQTLADSAKAVDTAHDKLVNARRNHASKRALFLAAEKTLQECEANHTKAKQAMEQQLTERS